MKRTILALAVLGAFGNSQAAMAQDAYPNRVIKLIVPFAPGGNTDGLTKSQPPTCSRS